MSKKRKNKKNKNQSDKGNAIKPQPDSDSTSQEKLPAKKRQEQPTAQEQSIVNLPNHKQNSIVKNIILLLTFLIALFSYLYFSTPIFFKELSLEPIKIYFSTSQSDIHELGISAGGKKSKTKAYKQKYKIPLIDFKIENPFKQSRCEISTKFDGFKKEIEFWEKEDANGISSFQSKKAYEYRKKHPPDYLIKAIFFEDNLLEIHSQIQGQQPSGFTTIEPFFKEGAYGVWKANYFFDTKFSGDKFFSEYYLNADVEKLKFQINVPDSFRIDESPDTFLNKIPNGFELIKELKLGETLAITLYDKNKVRLGYIINFISPTLFGIVLGMMIESWYQRRKKYD